MKAPGFCQTLKLICSCRQTILKSGLASETAIWLYHFKVLAKKVNSDSTAGSGCWKLINK